MDKETVQSGEGNTPVIEIHEDSFRFRVPRESDFEEQEADFLRSFQPHADKSSCVSRIEARRI
jgi:hypothetical protein